MENVRDGHRPCHTCNIRRLSHRETETCGFMAVRECVHPLSVMFTPFFWLSWILLLEAIAVSVLPNCCHWHQPSSHYLSVKDYNNTNIVSRNIMFVVLMHHCLRLLEGFKSLWAWEPPVQCSMSAEQGAPDTDHLLFVIRYLYLRLCSFTVLYLLVVLFSMCTDSLLCAVVKAVIFSLLNESWVIDFIDCISLNKK